MTPTKTATTFSAPSHELSAYRRSECLILGVYQVTDSFPRQAEGSLVSRLRTLTTTISTLVLEGCARLDADGSYRAWTGAVALLEELTETLDLADGLGFLRRDDLLELLEIQSGTLVDVLVLLGTHEEPLALAA